jgi:hypothetical protein
LRDNLDGLRHLWQHSQDRPWHGGIVAIHQYRNLQRRHRN